MMTCVLASCKLTDGFEVYSPLNRRLKRSAALGPRLFLINHLLTIFASK